MTAFEDFVNTELPRRSTMIRGTSATGNPNDSVLPEVNNAPFGSWYLQDDTVPKILFQKTLSGSGGWQLVQVLPTPFIVGPPGSGEPFDDIGDALDAAGLVATEDEWASVIVTVGDYGDGTVIDFPPYILLEAEQQVSAKSTQIVDTRSVNFRGGFNVTGDGNRLISGIRVYTEIGDDVRLFDTSSIGAYLEDVLIINNCVLFDFTVNPTLGRGLYTNHKITINDSVLWSHAVFAGAWPPFACEGLSTKGTAYLALWDSFVVFPNENTANEILMQALGTSKLAEIELSYSTVQGRIQAKNAGASAQIVANNDTVLFSNGGSAVDLTAGAILKTFLGSRISLRSKDQTHYEVSGSGTVQDIGVVSSFGGWPMAFDPLLTINQKVAFLAFVQSVPGDWNASHNNVSDSLDELAARVKALEGP
jgi:hypothetical protein